MTTPDTRIAAPQRTCIGCRQTRPQDELVRCTISSIAGSPQGAVVSRTAAGRGVWLCSMSCYQTAVQRKAFDRSWKQSVPAEALLVLGESLRDVFDRDLNDTDLNYTDLNYTDLNYTDLNCTDLNYTDMNYTDMKESSVVGIAPYGQTPTKG